MQKITLHFLHAFFMIFCVFVISLCFAFAININEINYNPLNQTYGDEYVEIYSNPDVNLSNFVVCDGNVTEIKKCNSLILHKKVNSKFSIITVNNSNYMKEENIGNASVYLVNETRIGSYGLSNEGECVYLFLSNFLIDVVCYPGNGNKGNSYQLYMGEWQECPITPGYENFCEIQAIDRNFIVHYPEFILNKENLFVVTIETFLNTTKKYDVKISVLDNNNKTISRIFNGEEWQSSYYYVNNITLNESFILKITNDYVGNATMEVKIKESGTSNIEAEYELLVVIVESINFEGELNNSNNSNNSSNSSNSSNSNFSQNNENESRIKILEYPENSSDESIIKIKTDVYRGDTRKYAVYAYIYDKKTEKKVSETTVFYANKKFVDYTVTIPIVINKISSAKHYTIVVEGLDAKDEVSIFLFPKAKTSSNSNSNSTTRYTTTNISRNTTVVNMNTNEMNANESVEYIKNQDRQRQILINEQKQRNYQRNYDGIISFDSLNKIFIFSVVFFAALSLTIFIITFKKVVKLFMLWHLKKIMQ